MKILLDTNAYSAYRRGHLAVGEMVWGAEGLWFSTVVLGELLQGFYGGSRPQENIKELKEFLASPRVRTLPVTYASADRFGRIAAGLRKKGTPLPSNDIWIAAQAMESGADLISFDQHFEKVDGLSWICPTQ